MSEERSMEEQITREPTATEEEVAEEMHDEPAPVGTLFLLMIFLAGMAGLWGTIYYMLMTR